MLLAFELAGWQPVHFSNLLQRKLVDQSVQKAIQSALEAFILKRMNAGTVMNAMTGKDALDLLGAITSSAGKLEAAALKKIKNSPDYQKIKGATEDFQRAAQSAPMGVWIDKDSRTLFIAGLALVIGGAAVLYATKTGGAIPNALVAQIKGKPFQVFKVGKFTMQGQLLAFQPDKQILGAGTVFVEKWQRVQVSASLGIIAAATSVQQINGSVVVKSHPFDITLTGTDDLSKKTVNLGLSVGFGDGPKRPLKVGLGAVVTDGKVTGETLDASLKTAVGDFGLKAKATTKEYQGLATWTVHFPG